MQSSKLQLKILASLKLWRSGQKLSYGFTLIELLIVIAIIGILAGLIINFVPNAQKKARDAQRKSDLRQIQSAFEIYRSDLGSYPASISCGGTISGGSPAVTYMQKIPCDPNNSGLYVYSYTVSGSTYSLFACLENVNDGQKDASNNSTYCTGGTTNWSFTLNNP